MNPPSCEEFCKGYKEFKEHETRDAMYKVATFLISSFWGKPSDMTDGLGVLLLTWNQAFYRYGIFNFNKLEKCITDNLQKIENFSNRDILSLSNSDEENIKDLFNKFLEALQIDSDKKVKKSSVSVAKALHLLASEFFPLWDQKIAKAYECYYNKNPAERYFSFCKITKDIADKVKDCDEVKDYIIQSGKTLVKLIDEYNYSKYTQGWI